MIASNPVTFNAETDKIGIYEKYIYDHPVVLKFNYSLFKNEKIIIKDENNNPLYKFSKKDYGKITDMNDNVIFNFRLDIKGLMKNDITLHTYLDKDIFNTKNIKITRLDKHLSYQLIYSDTENKKMKFVVKGNNNKNMTIYYYDGLNKIEICKNTYKNGENTININSGVDTLMIFSIVSSILQLIENSKVAASA